MVILDLYENGNFNEYGGELGELDWPFVLTLEEWDDEQGHREYSEKWLDWQQEMMDRRLLERERWSQEEEDQHNYYLAVGRI